MPISQTTTAGDVDNANGMIAELANSTIALISAPFSSGKVLVLANLTIATFSGYANQTIATVPAPIIDQQNGGISLVLPQHTFVFTPPGGNASPVPNTIYGWILLDSASNIVASGTFDSPVSMAVAMDAIPLQVLLNYLP